jgi:peptidoglycan/LPS O-acetylase OafA/YrhL
MMADRALALDALTSQLLGPARLLLLWGLAAGSALGWAVVVTALTFFAAADDPFSTLTGTITLVLGLAILVPSGIGLGMHVRRDRPTRELLWHWAALAPEPAHDDPWQARGLRRLWQLASLGLAALGLGVGVTAFVSLDANADVFTGWMFILGLCAVLCVTATLGLLKVRHHRRWTSLVDQTAAINPR